MTNDVYGLHPCTGSPEPTAHAGVVGEVESHDISFTDDAHG